ncbi:MAG TPA: thiamine pyrophosphate-binding protein [Vicinamibacterales bacterium]|nr:thiamine pyrophosphate-binding protein [Vicinamibacterales bacterium]
MNNVDLIVRMLRDAGARHAFGIPSGNVIPLLDALRRGGIEFVLTAHEGSAAFAADVTGRLTGAPGVCLGTMGPGATNLATGVGCASLDRSPLVAITCNVPTHQLGRRVQMVIDHHALFKPITKATCPLRTGRVATTLADLIGVALSEPHGPVHLDLPEDVSLAASTEEPIAAVEPRRRDPAPEADVERLGELLKQARRPLAVIGASARRMNRPERLRAFIERHGIPFASTTMAKGMIDEDHPLSIGCIERAKRQVQRKFLRSSDLIVGLGYDVVEVEYEQWIGTVPLASVDIERVDADATVKIAHEVIGDLDASLERMLRLAPGRYEWAADAARKQKDAFQAALRPKGGNGFTPHEAIDVARAVLPPEGILAFDVGAHTHQIASQWTSHAPGDFLITNGWSSMGFGIPAAIAAKLARPDLPVLCIVGDGCFQMTCGEVAVAQRLGLSLPILVLDDGWLTLIELKQMKRKLPVYGTDVTRGDRRDAPAHYFGAPAVTVRGARELERELKKAFRASGPTVIEAVVDRTTYSETVYD